MSVYRVLDVREKESLFSYQDEYNRYERYHTVFVVIAEDMGGNRKRFDMYQGYKDLFLGDCCYRGYTGDYKLIVAGDFIEVTETSTWPVVKILGVSNDT